MWTRRSPNWIAKTPDYLADGVTPSVELMALVPVYIESPLLFDSLERLAPSAAKNHHSTGSTAQHQGSNFTS